MIVEVIKEDSLFLGLLETIIKVPNEECEGVVK